MTRLQTGLCELAACVCGAGLDYAIRQCWTGSAETASVIHFVLLVVVLAGLLHSAFNVIAGLEGIEDL